MPAQVAFSLFRALTQVSPVWLSMGLWHMARNPLQYSWLVLLLVLVTGLGVMATTVGGTLDRSQRERVLYNVATHIRVSNIQGFSGRSREFLRERYLTIPGVASASLALRGRGTMGASFAGNQFNVLALESQDFSHLSWYRDDFSTRPISGVMLTLQLDSRYRPILIPEGATGIGVWDEA